MSSHSIADTKNRLSELVSRVEKGEEVVITRHGRPVAKLTGIQPKPHRITKEDVEWLRKHRVKGKIPDLDSGTMVSRMRDEEWVERLLRR
ncbi:MAG TPA: type II toxin-antitoxin system prevent-host-death family antitoxin [Rhizomicrobium sp.]|jgi:prevent-host-death family protein|nr:type II toxin-antitoxin system prevent-host-death family antitoxin [Rhizomicrobium sp.]